MICRIKDEWPTLAQVADDLSTPPNGTTCTVSEVLEAALTRQVPVVNNRVPVGRLGDIYLQVRGDRSIHYPPPQRSW